MCCTWHFALPDTTKLPDMTWSPGFLRIASGSPVMRLSLTSMLPSTMTPSAQICLPVERIVISSRTISSMAISFSSPSRMTIALGAESRLNLSIVRFERIPWKIPTAQLPTMRIIKPKLPRIPTSKCAFIEPSFWNSNTVKNKRIIAKATKTKLKNVRIFSRSIWGIDLVLMVCSPLILPSATREATSSAVKPVSAFV